MFREMRRKKQALPIEECAAVLRRGSSGVLAVLGEKHSLPPLLVLTLKTGVCGGFTTFSTFALETSQLFQNGSYGLGIGYVCASVILSIVAVQLACLWLS